MAELAYLEAMLRPSAGGPVGCFVIADLRSVFSTIKGPQSAVLSSPAFDRSSARSKALVGCFVIVDL
jgi:hypothetical protein